MEKEKKPLTFIQFGSALYWATAFIAVTIYIWLNPGDTQEMLIELSWQLALCYVLCVAVYSAAVWFEEKMEAAFTCCFAPWGYILTGPLQEGIKENARKRAEEERLKRIERQLRWRHPAIPSCILGFTPGFLAAWWIKDMPDPSFWWESVNITLFCLWIAIITIEVFRDMKVHLAFKTFLLGFFLAGNIHYIWL